MLKIHLISKLSKEIYKNGELLKPQTEGSSGIDLKAIEICEVNNLNTPISLENNSFNLESGKRCLIKTGIKTEFDKNFEIQVRSRSGLALKSGVIVLNSPGTIDSDFRGEIGIILFNTSEEDFTINLGDRIAQMVFLKIEKPEIIITENLSNSERNLNGFGSTGK